MRVVHVTLVAAACALAACGKSEPAKPDAPAKGAAPEPKAPIVPTKKAADWCGEHGLPESVCTKCNPELVAQFKAKGDWCDQHEVPKSWCAACDPAVAEKLKAMAPR
jgi:membrane fusion protein, heavy metal efflux system